jgi:hypothetical protein
MFSAPSVCVFPLERGTMFHTLKKEDVGCLLIYIYKKLKLCGCMFAYSSRMDAPMCTKLSVLVPWGQEEILKMSKPRKRCPEFESR